MKKIELYTDGACSGNPGNGGWGYLLKYRDVQKENYGGLPQTTNNQMELTAVIEGLKALKEPCHIDLYTDSKYVLEGATKWLVGWKEKGWKKADKKMVLNQELWQELDSLLSQHQIEWHWVKGHAGHPENERVDKLACQGRDLFAPKSKQ
ncbi:MAG: ribonuclease HI [Alphaproteobacteria bacterium]|nr:ribonuclease HI [Alphaproteobacteria bacterium]MBQ6854336.1 ribonuclease HI [Alphaproteobacteria bacterium]